MQLIDHDKFMATHKHLKEVYWDGYVGEWEVRIYQDLDDGCYYVKGPFARWDAIAIKPLGNLTDEALDTWIKNHENYNKTKGIRL